MLRPRRPCSGFRVGTRRGTAIRGGTLLAPCSQLVVVAVFLRAVLASLGSLRTPLLGVVALLLLRFLKTYLGPTWEPLGTELGTHRARPNWDRAGREFG